MCGIIKPTKAIGPAIAVVAPHNITPAIAHKILTNPVFTPRPVANSSPKDSAFNAGVDTILITNPTIRNGSTALILSHVAPLKLPTCQNLYASITSARGSIIKLTKDDKIALTAEPAKASFIGVIPPAPIDAIPYTQIAVIAAPTSANQIYPLAVLKLKNVIPITTNKDAPVFTPKILGSAIGLRVIDCISAPDTPRDAPAIRLNTVLGIRSRTTNALKDISLLCVKELITSLK